MQNSCSNKSNELWKGLISLKPHLIFILLALSLLFSLYTKSHWTFYTRHLFMWTYSMIQWTLISCRFYIHERNITIVVMTKLEYDSKIYNSTAPFHISLWKIFETYGSLFWPKNFYFYPKLYLHTCMKANKFLNNVQFLFVCTWCNHGGLQAKIQEQLGYLFLNFFN